MNHRMNWVQSYIVFRCSDIPPFLSRSFTRTGVEFPNDKLFAAINFVRN
jgi:hypothetical protein